MPILSGWQQTGRVQESGFDTPEAAALAGFPPESQPHVVSVAIEGDNATVVIEQGWPRRLPLAAEETLFRIAQEALGNVAKYARPGSVAVTLATTSGMSRLTIADDGCGFDPSAWKRPGKNHGWGLMIMRERAAAVGAELSVESAPGRGTRVIVTVRHHAQDSAERGAMGTAS